MARITTCRNCFAINPVFTPDVNNIYEGPTEISDDEEGNVSPRVLIHALIQMDASLKALWHLTKLCHPVNRFLNVPDYYHLCKRGSIASTSQVD